ncbi:MAG: invasion associated locus B family protein [Pseudomonadota bacterium]
MRRTILLIALASLGLSSQAAAKDSLGVFSNWAAFRDTAGSPRCYAIAKAQGSARDYAPYASVATWPTRNIRGQLHFRLSRRMTDDSQIVLRVGETTFELIGGGGDAWARDKSMDAAIIAAMRSASTMRVSARSAAGGRFTDRYRLNGAATAMDAAVVGCASLGSER